MIRPILIAFFVCQISALATPGRAADVVGSVGAVNPEVTGTVPGAAAETLRVGMPLHSRQRIVSNAEGSAQLTFLDRSTLNVGKNCDLVIDDFVYNPSAQSGSMTATMTKGLLRFVGGQISHTSGVTVNTPVATMGIRGGVASIGFVDGSQTGNAGKGLLVVNSVGTVTIRNKVSQVTLSQSGFAVLVKSDRTPIAAPFRLPDMTARFLQSKLTSNPSQTGGVPATVLARPIGAVAPAPQPAVINALDYTAVFAVGNNIARSQGQTKQAAQVLDQVAVTASTLQASTLQANGIAPAALIALSAQQGAATSTSAASPAAVAALVTLAKPVTQSGTSVTSATAGAVATLLTQVGGTVQNVGGTVQNVGGTVQNLVGSVVSTKSNNGNHYGQIKNSKD